MRELGTFMLESPTGRLESFSITNHGRNKVFMFFEMKGSGVVMTTEQAINLITAWLNVGAKIKRSCRYS